MAKTKKTKANKRVIFETPEFETIAALSSAPLIGDGHVHSKTSFDGWYDIQYLVWSAIANNLSALAITDHNTARGIVDYMNSRKVPLTATAFKSDKGLWVVPGAEITCRVGEVENLKGNSTKVHMLAYGCDWSENSPISRLLKIKSENDRLVDIGKLEYILKEKGLDTIIPEKLIQHFMGKKREEVSGFSTLGLETIAEFLSYISTDISDKELAKLGFPAGYRDIISTAISDAGLSLKSNRSLQRLYSQAPNYQRLNLDARDVLSIIHASGGIGIMAHPGVNMKRTNHQERLIETLIVNGIDGFEIANGKGNSSAVTIIKGTAKKMHREDEMIYTAGSDTHNFNGGNSLGRNKDGQIFTSDMARFFSRLDALQKSRDRGETVVSSVDMFGRDIEDIIHGYEERAKECIGAVRVSTVPTDFRALKKHASSTAGDKKPKTNDVVHTPPKKKGPQGIKLIADSGAVFYLEGCETLNDIDKIKGLNYDEYMILREWLDRNCDNSVLADSGLFNGRGRGRDPK